MEFKGVFSASALLMYWVDIGTEWNLKMSSKLAPEDPVPVDIGTEWNLKFFRVPECRPPSRVDIGTEWNLKVNLMKNCIDLGQ